jgi:hypothetical protein
MPFSTCWALAMNSPEFGGFKNPPVLPIRSTHRSLFMRWVTVRSSGGGASAAYLAGSTVEFRLMNNQE